MADDKKRPFILGVGLGRTGTSSLKMAFEDVLKVGKCYHMKEAMGPAKHHQAAWVQAQKNSDAINWSHMFDGYAATTDMPGCIHYKSILQYFPDAKCVLSLRDSPEKWAESIDETFQPMLGITSTVAWNFVITYVPFLLGFTYSSKAFTDIIDRTGRPPWFGSAYDEEKKAFKRETLCEIYTNWEKQVIADIPKEQLLIWNAKEGWGPLCKFLDLPVPDVPFPRANDRAVMHKMFKGMWWSSHIVFGLVLAAICFVVMKILL